MKREFHVRICGSLRGKFPWATRLLNRGHFCIVQSADGRGSVELNRNGSYLGKMEKLMKKLFGAEKKCGKKDMT